MSANKDQDFADLNSLPIVRHEKEVIDKLRDSAQLASSTLSEGMKAAVQGATTDDIDKAVHEHIIKHDAYPTPIDYMHFPKSVCTSVNEVLCHGIPDERPLRSGDYCKFELLMNSRQHRRDVLSERIPRRQLRDGHDRQSPS